MGEYTPGQKLYKVAANEIVNAESNLNYNWRKLDDSVRHLLGWAPTDKTSLYEEDHDPGRKFLKRQSNSTWICDATNTPRQDTQAFVNTWTLIPSSVLDPAWEPYNDPNFGRLAYSVDADGDISLRGTLQMVGQAAIPLKTTINVITALPVGARPDNPRYLFKHCGNADTPSYSVVRFFIGATGLVSIVRSGVAQSTAAERYITFNGLTFPRTVGA